MDNQTTVQRILRSELSFYGTIIAAVISIAAFYFGVTNQINLIAQKLDTHLEATAYMPLKLTEIGEKVAVLINQNK